MPKVRMVDAVPANLGEEAEAEAWTGWARHMHEILPEVKVLAEVKEGLRVWICGSVGLDLWACRSAGLGLWVCGSVGLGLRACGSVGLGLWVCGPAGLGLWVCG
eukprot:CAMPEP_0198208424 /NCGR_PEP_ID=MMETSP1445-20131203/11789_1 /TAXON_ID=36898 /ORGANISM="Pyramimonas sp., Strain CCMP2087" /LENGTH=103 /DNA_ID=CAMNT_0043881815 /DNA_START=135 /DNA_END=442 /DNA_ORIENTATION=+